MSTINISKNIFRAYDIRGQVGKEWCLNDDFNDAYLIGQAIGGQLERRGSHPIIVGRDARNSSPAITKQLIRGLVEAGCIVTDIGITATPALYFALSHLTISNGIMVTGSHNPADHNGIKIVYAFSPISATVIQSLYYDIKLGDFTKKSTGKHLHCDSIVDDYQQAIVSNIKTNTTDHPLKVGIDCGNGATSLFSESLFSQLGYDVYPLFCELEGDFPNHSPDPTVPENLIALSNLVKQNHLDIGIAFDGDGDRLIAIDAKGKIIWPDRLMILLAQDILEKKPSSSIVFDVKCSYLLPKSIQQSGGQPAMCASGHSILKMHMKRLNASMGGEFSGHIVLRDRWSDFDDAPYVAARLLELLSKKQQQDKLSPTEVFAKIADSYSTPQYELDCENSEEAQQLLDYFIHHTKFPGANLSLIDGIRVDYEDGWGLMRSSNTRASLTFRFEAETQKRLEEIQAQFRTVFTKINSGYTVPF